MSKKRTPNDERSDSLNPNSHLIKQLLIIELIN